jgi:translocation and assembly module TamB
MRARLVHGLKILALVVAGLVVLLALIAGGLWWWAGTQSSLDWTLRRIAASEPLSAEGVQGSLRSGVNARHLQWEKDGLKIEAFDAQLAWQPLALMRGTIRLDHLRAARLRVEDRRPPKPRVIPVSLVLPMRVEVAEVTVGQVQWIAAANSFEAAGLAGSYSFNTVNHQVRLDRLRWAGGSYSGEARLGAHGSLPVDAKVQGKIETPVPGSSVKLPLAFTASLEGPITDLQGRASLRGAEGSATASTRATAAAHITPWADQPVPEARADFVQLDAGAIWPQAPHTSLAGQVQVQPAGTGSWAISLDASNAQPGPWDKQRLPLQRVSAAGEWRAGGQALVRRMDAEVGGGKLRATGEWQGKEGWRVECELAGVDPAAVHSAMASLPVSGRAILKGEGSAIDFDLALSSGGKARSAGKGQRDDMGATLAALELREAKARGRWQDGLLTLPLLDVRMADAALKASGEARPQSRSGSGIATLAGPSLQARIEGKLSQTAGGGTLRASSGNVAQALRWLARWPGIPDSLTSAASGGRADVELSWQGGWADPAVQGTATVPVLELRGASAPWTVRDAVMTLDGRLADAALQARGRAEQGARKLNIEFAGRGGRRGGPSAWQGQLSAFNAAVTDPALGNGNWTLVLQRPFDWRWAGASFEAGAGNALLNAPRGGAPAALTWEPVRWGGGELRTAGKLTGLPLAWAEFLGGAQFAGSALAGDMVFDAQWDANLGGTPRIRASIARSRGDVTVLAETAEGKSTRVAAGVREARLAVSSEGEAVTATLRWDSERGGTADGQVATRLTRGGASGWHWADDAPLSGSLQAQLPRIGVWSLLAPPGWRLRGSLAAQAKVAGTKAEPQLAGTVAADDLALRSVVDGIELQGGRLRAHLEGRRVIVDEFLLRGPGPNGGTLVARGEGDWTPSGPQARLNAEITSLRASIRSDRQLTVSGTIAARRDAAGTVVNGNLRVDQALIVMPDQNTPKLGDDVVLHAAAAPVTRTEARIAEQSAKPASQQLKLNVDIDLGNDFRVQGMGIDTRLRGTLALSGESATSPRIVGTIRAGGGEYQAYGQRLDIERGIIRFTGAPDNPSLDILAIRPNIVQRVGVQVTGTALAPYVRLYSEPDLPDAEKLSWLVTGRASAGSGAEAALVQQAALALLAGRSGGGKRGLAASLGLDEVSFRREGLEGPSVTLGKRFSRNFYAAYERSLSGALGTLYIFFDLTRQLTVRGQTGERTALDLIYTFSFD